MSEKTKHKRSEKAYGAPAGAPLRGLTRRSLLGTGTLLGLAALAHPDWQLPPTKTERAS